LHLKFLKKMYRHIFLSLIDNLTQHYGIPQDEIFSKRKDYQSVEPRQLFYYLCNKKNIPAVTIEKFLHAQGYTVHHSNILRGITKMNKKIESNIEDYTPLIKNLEYVHHNV